MKHTAITDVLDAPERTDLYVSGREAAEHRYDIARKLAESRVCVVKQFLSQTQGEALRTTLQNIHRVMAPIQASRLLLDKVAGSANLPSWARRQPVSVPLGLRTSFSSDSHMAIQSIMALHTSLRETPAMIDMYDGLSDLDMMRVNRTPANSSFQPHQDNRAYRGLRYVAETSPKQMTIEASRTMPGTEDFSLMLEQGDVLILAQRALALEATGPLPIQEGAIRLYADGSIVHSGQNLLDESNFSAALFSTGQ